MCLGRASQLLGPKAQQPNESGYFERIESVLIVDDQIRYALSEFATLADMKPTDVFITQKIQQAIRSLESARMKGANECTLRELALVVSRVQVNHLVKPLPSVRAAMVRFRSETDRHAAQLVAEQVDRYEAEPRSQQSTDELHETMRVCRGVFPREAAILRRALDAQQVGPHGAHTIEPET